MHSAFTLYNLHHAFKYNILKATLMSVVVHVHQRAALKCFSVDMMRPFSVKMSFLHLILQISLRF